MQPKSSRSLISNNSHKVTLLVIDQDATARLLIEVMLRRDGFNVILAAQSREANDVLKNQRVNGIILGGLFEGEGASGFCKSIRANPDTAHLPILMLLSSGNASASLDSKLAGANDTLVKPVIAGELIQKIRTLLRREG